MIGVKLRSIIAIAFAAVMCAMPARAWTLKRLYQFTMGKDGGYPVGVRLARDSATGDLYGTTYLGGDLDACNQGCGVVFKVAPDGTETVLHTFSAGDDGRYPEGGLVRDRAGNFYGTAGQGGPHGHGVVFKLTSDGTYKVLHAFSGNDGSLPFNGLTRDFDTGDIYGVTASGGAYAHGTVYRLSKDGTHTVLYSFMGGSDGSYPNGDLVRDDAGNLYGTTVYDGDPVCQCGTAYKIAPDGAFTLLHSFTQVFTGKPLGGLVMDKAGNLYGTTIGVKRSKRKGAVFSIAPNGTYDVLHRFGDVPDGASPSGTLLLERTGTMYGATEYGGDNGYKSTIFRIAPDGTEQVIYTFDYIWWSDGGLIEDKDGNLYGMDLNGEGSVFELVK